MGKRISLKVFYLVFILIFLFIYPSFAYPSVNEVYYIRNPKTKAEMIFNKDGKILLKAIDINSENVGIIEDAFTKEQKYLYKVFSGEKKVEKTYKVEGEKDYTDVYPSYRTVFYDLKGNELGISFDNVYGATYAFSDYIIYFDNKAHIFNVKTKIEKNTTHNYIEIFENFVLLSTERYIDGPQSILICDNNLNVLKTIVGFALDRREEVEGKKCFKISEKFSDAKINHYNYIDNEGNLLYKDAKEEEMDSFSSKEDKDALTIKNADNNIEWVETLYYDTKKIFVAHLKYEEQKDNSGNISYIFKSIIYDKNLNKINIGSTDINTSLAEYGYIIIDNKKIVNFDFSIVKEFDTPSLFTGNKKDGRIFFTDMNDIDYNKKSKFNLYDDKFNILMSNIEDISFEYFDKYIVIRGKDKTNLYTSNFDLYKEFNRRLDIVRFFGFTYPSFTDLDKNRMGVMDNEGNIIVDNLKKVCDISLNYFTYMNGFNYGLMDYKGKILFSFSIFDTLKEDMKEIEYVRYEY